MLQRCACSACLCFSFSFFFQCPAVLMLLACSFFLFIFYYFFVGFFRLFASILAYWLAFPGCSADWALMCLFRRRRLGFLPLAPTSAVVVVVPVIPYAHTSTDTHTLLHAFILAILRNWCACTWTQDTVGRALRFLISLFDTS